MYTYIYIVLYIYIIFNGGLMSFIGLVHYYHRQDFVAKGRHDAGETSDLQVGERGGGEGKTGLGVGF